MNNKRSLFGIIQRGVVRTLEELIAEMNKKQTTKTTNYTLTMESMPTGEVTVSKKWRTSGSSTKCTFTKDEVAALAKFIQHNAANINTTP